jgi:hypothetical protein
VRRREDAVVPHLILLGSPVVASRERADPERPGPRAPRRAQPGPPPVASPHPPGEVGRRRPGTAPRPHRTPSRATSPTPPGTGPRRHRRADDSALKRKGRAEARPCRALRTRVQTRLKNRRGPFRAT